MTHRHTDTCYRHELIFVIIGQVQENHRHVRVAFIKGVELGYFHIFK